MSSSNENQKWIRNELDKLYALCPHADERVRLQIRQYIDVGEYGLALDDLASIQLETGVQSGMPEYFDLLATRMEMKRGDGWDAVDAIRSNKN